MPHKFGSSVTVDVRKFEKDVFSHVKNLFDRKKSRQPSFEEVYEVCSEILPEDIVSRMSPTSKEWVRDADKYLSTLDDLTFMRVSGLIDDYFAEDGEEEGTKALAFIMPKVSDQMEGFRKVVSGAIQRAHGWTGSSVMIRPEFNNRAFDRLYEDENVIGVAEVAVGKSYMTVFLDGSKVESIGDLLEGGDDDMFESLDVQLDYMLLAKELENPGSTSSGKWITLWTARPTKDRAYYESATSLPKNVFLVNSERHAAGLSTDLGGRRDVWEVVVNTKDLIQTMDQGSVRYYQTTDTTPVRSMWMVK